MQTSSKKRELSEQAKVAKLCRQYCKSLGVKCSATSDSFSMGDSVTVRIKDQPPAMREQIETELIQYQYGSFNGMEDIYEYTNSRDDIPQTKYISIECEYTDDIKQSAWSWLKAKYANGDDKPESYEEARNMQWTDNGPHWVTISEEVYKILRGGGFGLDKDNSDEFWSKYNKPELAKVINISSSSVHIEEHEHTKKGFIMYMVILDSTLERDDFNQYRDEAKQRGGKRPI